MIKLLFVELAMDDIIVIRRTSDSKLMVELAAVVEMMMGVEDMVLSLLLLLL